ncbi:MAG TPA: helix-turn-helix domain-containing protein [Solirubrobacteraceae bacterium]|nr:helix-turn-helix domain-containing protein [Solirubrobacteraceae bacterium]
MRYALRVAAARAQPSLVASHPDLGPALAPRALVTESQRARLLEAVAQVVADRGYQATTVAEIVRAAGVSRSTFYELFESKEQCLVEAYRHGVDVLIARIRAAVRAAAPGGLRAQVRAANAAYLETMREEPRFARTYLIEIHRAGDAALQARAEALERFADGYRRIRRRMRPGTAVPPRETFLALAAGLDQLAAERVRAGRGETLDELEPTFTYCALAILAGPGPDAQTTTDGEP